MPTTEPSCQAHKPEEEAWKRNYCATCLRIKVERLVLELAASRCAIKDKQDEIDKLKAELEKHEPGLGEMLGMGEQ